MKRVLFFFLIGLLFNLFSQTAQAVNIQVSAPDSAELKSKVKIKITLKEDYQGEINHVSLFISEAEKSLPKTAWPSEASEICEIANNPSAPVSLKKILSFPYDFNFDPQRGSYYYEYTWDTQTAQTEPGSHDILAVGLSSPPEQGCNPGAIKKEVGSKTIQIKAQAQPSTGTSAGGTEGATLPTPSTSTTLNPLKITSWTPQATGIENLMKRIIGTLLELAGGFALLALIYSGLMYITSSGNPEKAERAKKNLLWSILGIIVILLCLAIPVWVSDILKGKIP